MNLEKAFSAFKVQLYRQASKESVDLYLVTSAFNDRLILEAPTGDLRFPPPSIEDAVYVETAQPDAIYRMKARVLAVAHGERVSITIQQESAIERVQRRRNVRVRTRVPVRVVEVDPPEPVPPARLLTEDLSAGGLRAQSIHVFRIAHDVRLTIDLIEGQPPIVCLGRVMRCCPIGTQGYDLGVAFVDLTQRDEDRIARFLMDLMRQRNKM